MGKNNTEKSVDFYLPPDVFFKEVIKSKQQGKPTEELGKMFIMLSEKVSNHRFWNRYTHIKDDLISENMWACLKGFEGFRPFKGDKVWNGEDVEYHHSTCNNPHAWFTTCCFNNLRQFIGREYKQANINNKIRIQNDMEPSHGYSDMVKDKEEKDSTDAKIEKSKEDKDKLKSFVSW